MLPGRSNRPKLYSSFSGPPCMYVIVELWLVAATDKMSHLWWPIPLMPTYYKQGGMIITQAESD